MNSTDAESRSSTPDEHLRSHRTRLRIEALRLGLGFRQARIPGENIAEAPQAAQHGGTVDRAIAALCQLALALSIRYAFMVRSRVYWPDFVMRNNWLWIPSVAP